MESCGSGGCKLQEHWDIGYLAPMGLGGGGDYFHRALPCAVYLAPLGLEEKKDINELTRIKDIKRVIRRFNGLSQIKK